MAKNKRIVFTFDQKTYDELERIRELGGFSSLAEAARESITLTRMLQIQSSLGFSDIQVNKPGTEERKTLICRSLTTRV
jgi:hypothetical protein